MATLTLDQEFEQMSHKHQFSKFGEILGDLRKEWHQMPVEHRDWARKISDNIPDRSKKLAEIEGTDAEASKARAKIDKEIEFRQAELIAFFQAPVETMVAGPLKDKPTRREVYKKAVLDRGSKLTDKVSAGVSWTVGVAVGAFVGASLIHGGGISVPHMVGDLIPAAKSIHVVGASVVAATGLAKKAFEEAAKKIKAYAFELNDWTRVAHDPKLEVEKAPDVLPIESQAAWEAKSAKINDLSRQTLPADKLELQRVKGEKIIEGLEATQKWRMSVANMSSAAGLTIAAAIKEQKKAIAKQKEQPEWATAEFKSLVELLGDKKNQRSVGGPMDVEWRQWHGLRALSSGNRILGAINASIQPVIKVDNAIFKAPGALIDRLTARRQGQAEKLEAAEPYNPKNWVSPPRAK